MNVIIREYKNNDIEEMIKVWNEIIDTGTIFPQIEKMSIKEGEKYFFDKSFTGVVENEANHEILGGYILHPNNIGRCGHISNASYAVKSTARGLGIGKKLVVHSMEKGKELGFKILQFNAVVKINHIANKLYEKLGFVKLGIIPNGFLMKNGKYEDIILYYINL